MKPILDLGLPANEVYDLENKKIIEAIFVVSDDFFKKFKGLFIPENLDLFKIKKWNKKYKLGNPKDVSTTTAPPGFSILFKF